MMNKLFAFLGGITFAVILIALVALFVIAGTILESITDSHSYASFFTYSNPVFITLLWLFFINILVSALRRWPFQKKHIPFLITHLGLLMILAGALTKGYFGIQGSMGIIEGSGTEKIFLPETYELFVEQSSPSKKWAFNLSELSKGVQEGPLKVKLVGYQSNVAQKPITWIRDRMGFIDGIPLANQVTWNHKDPLPVGTHYRNWKIIALKTDAIENAITKTLINRSTLTISEEKIPLLEALKNKQKIHNHTLTTRLKIAYDAIIGLDKAILEIYSEADQTTLEIPLIGDKAGILFNPSTPFLGNYPVELSLISEPTILLIEDSDSDIYFIALGPQGQIFSQTYRGDNLTSLITYDKGFGGYYVGADIPFSPESPKKLEWDLDSIKKQLQQAKEANIPIAPPLEMLQKACRKVGEDFPEICVSLLKEWNEQYCWLFPNEVFVDPKIQRVMNQLDWGKEKAGCQAISDLFNRVESMLNYGYPSEQILASVGVKGDPYSAFTAFTQNLLKDPLEGGKKNTHTNTRLFTAFLRAYGIHLQTIGTKRSDRCTTSFETPLSMQCVGRGASKKIESNTPMIVLQANEEIIALPLDHYGTGLKWPILKGQYLVRFQPQFQTIPYRIRLRDARQINYPNSFQPLSYESDIIVTDLRSKQREDFTLSMNQVYQTWDGYRFYLSNISPGDESAIQKVHIVVNHDPAKYFLTYPGALIVTIGMVLLFTRKRRETDEK